MTALLAAIATIAVLPVTGAKAQDWQIGDVFANTPDGPTALKVFDNAGNFKEEFGDPSLTGEGTGCAFDASQNLYATFFQMNETFKFSSTHPHPIIQSIPNPGTNESIVFDSSGNFYIGMADTAGDQVRKYDPAGNFLDSYLVVDDRGADWIDLAVDQTTLFYNGEGRTVRRYDLATKTQLPDFAVIPGSGNAFAVRILPPGDGSGGVLVADGVDIKRLDGAGNVVQTYDAPSVGTWFALNLDPNGTSFWSADISGGQVFRFNIVTGAIEVGPIEAHPSEVAGLCVLGELTAAVPPSPPQPPAEPTPQASNLALEITGRKNQKVVGPQVKPSGKAKNNPGKLVSVKVTCLNSPCNAKIKGKAKAPGEKVKLKGPEISLQAGETKRVRLKAGKSQLADLKATLRAGAKGKVKITGVATDPAGAEAKDNFRVKLRGR